MNVDKIFTGNDPENGDPSNWDSSAEPVYLKHFGFSEAPFSIAPDPHYLYMTQQHQEALAHLLYGIRSSGGFVLLTGEVGTGKTTVCRCFMERLPKNCEVAFIINPRLDPRELLLTICEELLVFPAFLNRPSTKELIDRINSHLLKSHAEGRNAVLIIDEAQNLSLEVLEQMRLLTNLETDKRKLLQIIMIGQPELRDMLDRPEVRQLAQRITARYHLGPLSADQTAEYIHHRLTVAGCRQTIFTGSAIRRIHKMSQGIPRVINVLCDRALLGAYVEGQTSVDRAVVKRAAREVFGASRRSPGRRRGLWGAGLGLLVVLLLITAAYLADRALMPWQIKLRPWNPAARVRMVSPVEGEPNENPAIEEVEKQGARSPTQGQVSPPAAAAVIARSDREQKAVTTGEPSKEMVKKATDKPLRIGSGSDERKPVESTIDWKAGLPRERSRLLAFRALFQRWGIPGAPDKEFDVCTRAGIEGLQCLVGQGSWQDLLRFNRPCVLKMEDSGGKSYYVALMKVEGAEVACVKDGETVRVGRDRIEQSWKGEFSMLWKPPPSYQREIRRGDSGPIVAWLAARLSLLFHSPVKIDEGARFGDALLSAVKRFQAEAGLAADGIVGPQTLIEINNRTERRVPRLIPQSEGKRDVLHSKGP